ncbi:hypothetical protein [Ruegeria arenilitoris]|uniref:hypothetical protein n=1 Tax=Ruegeria arenilitoris TaxID=1173585 RepID=UPI00147F5B8D|nr:hypothetical protein [Ruegeria arenilitoris]
MEQPSALRLILGVPRLIWAYSTNTVKRALFIAAPPPETQEELARLVERTFQHEIRAGYEHRFIRLMFVTVGERVFCRQYQFSQHSWRDVFLRNPEGQIRMDKTVVNIEASEPEDYDHTIPAVDQAYADTLRKIGASFLLAGAVTPRAQRSTMEITLATKKAANGVASSDGSFVRISEIAKPG